MAVSVMDSKATKGAIAETQGHLKRGLMICILPIERSGFEKKGNVQRFSGGRVSSARRWNDGS